MKDFSEKKLDDILKGTVSVMEESRTQIFDIYENARSEVDNIQRDITQIREKVLAVIAKVDAMELEEIKARNRLAVVSSNFKTYSEEDIKSTYENVRRMQIELAVLREQEQHLRMQRDNFEMRLKKLQGTVDKAKQLVAQVGVVLGYLSAHMGNVVMQVEAVTEDKIFGAQVIKAHENERLRVSREIHDGPAQVIANMIYHASICERLIDIDTDRAKEGLQELRTQIRSCLSEIRKIIFDLRPMSLDDLGLVPAIEQFLERFQCRTDIKVDLQVLGQESKLDKHIEISVFRIVQESLNNIHKHADVKEAKLVLELNPEYISVFVEDHGKGFVVDSLQTEEAKAECYGLLGMKERSKLLRGQFLLESAPGKGTKIRMLIPLCVEKGGEGA